MSGSRVGCLLALAVALRAEQAIAHETKGEQLWIDVGESTLQIETMIPPEQWALARKRPFTPDLLSAVAAEQSELRADVGKYLRAETSDGAAFRTEVQDVIVKHVGDGDSMVALARLHAPEGRSAREFVLHDDIVLHRVPSHVVQVFLRRDLQSNGGDTSPTMLGQLGENQRSLSIDRGARDRWAAFRAVFHVGLHHIAEGADHLLFLLMLLLPAPLRASGRQWGARAGLKPALWHVAKLATAFTLGHSLTLAIGAIRGNILPSRWVESFIALTILAAAAHALRPIFVRREFLITAAAGLIHGLAFSTALGGLGFETSTLAQAVFGFNLGVEAMQLGVLLLCVPLLVLASRSPRYKQLKDALAWFGVAAALGWFGERALGLPNPMGVIFEML